MATQRSSIYTPRVCIDMLAANPSQANKSTCTMIPYRGYLVSIAMDSSHGDGDLFRSDLLIRDAQENDVTFTLLPMHDDDSRVVPATAEALKEAFAAIDAVVDAAVSV